MTAEAHCQRARLLIEQSRFIEAEAELRLALSGDPDHALAHALLALVLSQLGRHADAGAEADVAVGQAPDDPFVHYARGQVLLARRHFPEALAAAAEAVRLDPEDPYYHRLVAAVLLAQERWEEALEAAERALALEPENTRSFNLRATALRQLARPEDAGAALASALARNPEDAWTHANRGWTHLQRGEAAAALEAFREALRLDPECEYARDGMVQALKARYLVYRWLLRYYLWMGRLSEGARWGVVVGGYIAYRITGSLARAWPEGRPVLWTIMGLYIGFCLLSWLGAPFFNLILRLNRYGRMIMSRDERWASNALALCLLGAAAFAGAAFVTARPAEGVLAAIMLLAFSMPLSACFQCERGWPRWAMALLTAALGLVGAAALLQGPFGGPGSGLLPYYGWGLLGVTLAGNALGAAVPRR